MRRIEGVCTLAPGLALLVVWTASCTSGPKTPPHAPRAVTVVDRWEVTSDGQLVGTLVRMQIEDEVASEPFFQVKNDAGQWLGYIDHNGRVYERVPFSMTEVFRGIHPMEAALAMLFDDQRTLTVARIPEPGTAEADAGTRGEPVPASAFRPPYHRDR